MAQTTVNFNLKTAGYANYANQTLTFKLLNAGAEAASGDQTYVTLPGIVTATSAANGDGSVTLYRNGKSGIESIYEVILPNREKAKFIIPSGSATIELATLLVDHATIGSNTQQSSVYAAAIQRANQTGTQTLSTISDAGTIASQASNSVSISGGSISGVTLTASTANLTDATDKRLMTDAQEAKLDTVETNADVTDATNVAAAGALMDSELTDLAGIKGVTISTLQVKPSEGAFENGDKTKLNGIEASATADQTASEIKALVESATDSNVFTDADHTKLNGIEASATADQTNAEIRAAVEAATDSNVFTDADHTKLNGIEASATADQTNAEIRAAVEAATDSNVFTDADHTKLNGLDANAKAQVNFVPNSISFTNTSAYLSLADNANLDVDAADFTLAFWARLESSGTEPVLNKLSGTGYRLRFVSGALILTMQDSSGSADFSLATGLNDNKWHTYVVTVDRSGNAIAYVDNVAQTGVEVSGTALTLANSGQFQIGSDGGSNAGDGIALGNYVILITNLLDAGEAARIYFSPDSAPLVEDCALMVDLRKSTNTFADVGTNGFAVTTNGTIIFNESRIVQQSTTGTTTGFTAGSGTTAKDDSTFTGGSGTAYTIGDIVKALKAQGLLAQ